MGFLNHSTNNIIIDAVLTERGRELLAANDGSFEISAFTFADDEVDYSLITKYGLTVGREKIEKNTPIFEANPNENIALKHPLISFPNPLQKITEFPTLTWSNQKSGQSRIELKDVQGSSDTLDTVQQEIIIKNSIAGAASTFVLDSNINDSIFLIKMHNDLLKIASDTIGVADTDLNNIATYRVNFLAASNADFTNQRQCQFTVYSNGVVTADAFSKFARIGDANKINTSIQIIGQSSGASIIIPVTISRNTAS